MKISSMISIALMFTALATQSALAEEPRNQYSNSLMLEAPPAYEDPNYQTESEQHQQFCRDLQKQISEQKNQPIRRNASKERYQKECVGN